MTAHGGGPGGPAGDAGRAAQERLTEEARATASALLDWLGTRLDAPAAPGGHRTSTAATGAPSSTGDTRSTRPSGSRRLGMRPPQSPGPCSWCPVCALVAALRGEQPELTARLAEQASGLMMLLRLMVQAHQDPAHYHTAPAPTPHETPGPPPDWPAEWGAWDGWGATPPAGAAATSVPGDAVDAATGPHHAPVAAPGSTPTPDTTAPTGTGARRRAPVRRASPRSAAFRAAGTASSGTAHAPVDTGLDQSDAAGGPGTTGRPERAEEAKDRTRGASRAGESDARPTARPSVQRIAIRRPPGRGRTGDGADGPAC